MVRNTLFIQKFEIIYKRRLFEKIDTWDANKNLRINDRSLRWDTVVSLILDRMKQM